MFFWGSVKIECRFVSAVHIPGFDPGTLISAGGDPMMKVWDWMEGVVKCEVGIWEGVVEYVGVRPRKRRRGRRGEVDSDDDGEEVGEGKGKSKGKGKGKGKKNNKGVADERGDEGEEGPMGNVESEAAASGSRSGPTLHGSAGPAQTDHMESTEKGKATLVVHKIDSLDTGRGRYIIFSAVGFVSCVILSPVVYLHCKGC